MNRLYELKLGEVFIIRGSVWIRVPGGWVYSYRSNAEVFIPYSKEFITEEYN